MVKLLILSPGLKVLSYTTKRLYEEARKQSIKTQIAPLMDIVLRISKGLEIKYGKENLLDYDYFLPRIDSKRASVGYPVVRFLDHFKVKKPYPAETILIAHNKFLTLEMLAKENIPIPETYMTASKQAARNILKKQKIPVIMKLLSGFGGQGVLILESREAANSAIEALRTLNQEIFIEEYIPNPGEDIRGIVAGSEVIASYKRVAAKGEKRANIYAGGRAVTYKLSDELNEIVLKTARAVNAKICAVDLIQGKDRTFVTEVNINPGLGGIEKVTDLNVAQSIIDYIKTEIKR